MKIWIAFIILFTWIMPQLIAQETTDFNMKRKRHKLSFELINNLIVIPVTVNDIQLRFILDSGVGTTLIFNNQNVEKIFLDQLDVFNLQGLGKGPLVKASLSKGNTIAIKSLTATNQEILLIDETNFEFIQRMGVQIDGIIGHTLIKDYLLRIDYSATTIEFFKYGTIPKRHLKNGFQLPLIFHKKNLLFFLTFKQKKE